MATFKRTCFVVYNEIYECRMAELKLKYMLLYVSAQINFHRF